eukprot:TRINITY_DN2694_c1_g2_i1.p1 TRINITY_DN2694_c1_g2~~TRINITY_DN2694_c1_g2_i1.p1  ORF type:complete len:1693 (+),score=399.45 TRINITY_DN2694_c1_g2_i1:31868-36946(+)
MEAQFQEAYDLDREYVLHSWSVQGQLNPKVVTKGEGIFYWDGDGNRYADFASQLVNLNLGHNHPKIIEAIKKQADEMCYISPSFVSPPRSKLAEKLIGYMPETFGKCFFTVGGADANENAVKIARAHTGRQKIITRYRSYHGATYGAISLTGDPRRPPVEPGVPGSVRVFDPYCYRCSFGLTYPECKLQCAENVREVIMYENPDTIAAVLMESVTGSNGIFPPPPGYMERIQEICREFGILLICDEVMTGFGRTGKMFGFQNFDISPDIVTMAKGVNSGYIPLGVVAMTSEVAKTFDDHMLYCGLTYSGHPLACASALGNLAAVEEDKLIENSAAMGEIFKAGLEKLGEKHGYIGDVRCIGLFGCLEMVKDRETREPMAPWNGAPGLMAHITKALLDNGIAAYVRWNYIFLTPPIIINEEEMNDSLERIDKALTVASEAIAKELSQMSDIIFQVPPRIVFGAGSAHKVGEEAKAFGATAMIVTGRSSTTRTGALDKIATSLETAGMTVVKFAEVESDPSVATVEKGAALAKDKGVDVLVALGGGSPMDAAKGIAILMTNDGPIQKYEKEQPSAAATPIIAVPTTAGTASEITRFTVITDPEAKIKMLIAFAGIIPKVAVLDPELTVSMPPSVTAATGMDALTHAMEAYISKAGNQLTAVQAIEAIELIGANLVPAVVNGNNMEARQNMLLGQMLAGFAFGNASVALVHSMSRPLGAHFGIPHGTANAMLLPAVMAFNRSACPEKFERIAMALGEPVDDLSLRDASYMAIEALESLFEETGLPGRLSDFGVTADAIPQMAQDAFASGSTNNNPRVPTVEDITEIYTSILQGGRHHGRPQRPVSRENGSQPLPARLGAAHGVRREHHARLRPRVGRGRAQNPQAGRHAYRGCPSPLWRGQGCARQCLRIRKLRTRHQAQPLGLGRRDHRDQKALPEQPPGRLHHGRLQGKLAGNDPPRAGRWGGHGGVQLLLSPRHAGKRRGHGYRPGPRDHGGNNLLGQGILHHTLAHQAHTKRGRSARYLCFGTGRRGRRHHRHQYGAVPHRRGPGDLQTQAHRRGLFLLRRLLRQGGQTDWPARGLPGGQRHAGPRYGTCCLRRGRHLHMGRCRGIHACGLHHRAGLHRGHAAGLRHRQQARFGSVQLSGRKRARFTNGSRRQDLALDHQPRSALQRKRRGRARGLRILHILRRLRNSLHRLGLRSHLHERGRRQAPRAYQRRTVRRLRSMRSGLQNRRHGGLIRMPGRGQGDNMDLVIKNARLPGAEARVDIGVTAGIIQRIGSPESLSAPRTIDAKGGLVAPPFVDPHVHLDAVLTAGDPQHNESGTLLEGIRIWGKRKERLSVEDIKERAYRAINWMVAQGVLFIRTHADVSEPTLTTVQALTELRDELRGLVDIQVVAFPQDGIYTNDDGERLMEEAIDLGVDVLGCIPHNEFTREDGIASVEYIMGLASETGLLVDIHCDETDDDQSRFIETAAAQTIKRELHGRVAASHATAMHSYNNAYAAKLIGLLARADVGIITNPFDNSILQARGDSYPKRRGVTRVDELLAAGVTVGIGHDSIMDPWYPLGKGSMLQAANLLLHMAQLSGRGQICDVFKMITDNSAKIMNIEDKYGIEEGKPATFVVLNADDEREAIRLMPECLYVVRDGRILAQTEPALSTVQLAAGKQIVDFRAPSSSTCIKQTTRPAAQAAKNEEPV